MPDNLTPGLMVLHGNRLEDLRTLMVSVLKAHPLPPLCPEVLLVQSNGMKHWLEMGLADDSAMGICAATQVELPSAYMWHIYRTVLGAEGLPQQMPFDKAVLVWRLMRLLPELAAADPVYAPLQRYLDTDTDGRKGYQLSTQVADVLDGYQSYRADWLADWGKGNDVLRSHDGTTPALGKADLWQARLWRDIQADVGAALAQSSRAGVHERFMQAMARLGNKTSGGAGLGESQRRVPGLPPRIVIFGISSLPMQIVQALAALGQFCQVLMFVQNPCRHYWGDIVEGHEGLRRQLRRRQQDKPSRTRSDSLARESDRGLDSGLASELASAAPTHPLLASWGKQGRDYLHLLDQFDSVDSYRASLERVDAFVDPLGDHEGNEDDEDDADANGDEGRPSLLARLQSAILNLEPLPGAPQCRAGDASIAFVRTHSAQREIEVLHDRLLAWFDADPGLEPGDVMVMLPDMEAFAPHIQAVFGRFKPGQLRHVPYSVADLSHRQSPLVQALAQLLSLPASRVSLADWLGLFEVAAVRSRFGLREADIDTLRGWLASAGVRWGLDAQHRKAWGFPAGGFPAGGFPARDFPERLLQDGPGIDQNTWAFGLRRLLLGYAVGQGEPWCATAPQSALSGLDGNIISCLLDWVDATNTTLVELSHEQTPAQWLATLSGIVERFFLASDEAEERLLQRILEPLAAWKETCDEARLDAPLPLVVVREHWLQQIEEPGLHQRFFGGGVQFATLMPMRSIPFKAVCLLGMNDGDYPRQMVPRDFDLMAQSWRAGDRSRREDDRYMFLEAILSAREKLYISWQGQRASDNALQPPSVLVAQLIDYLKAAWKGAPEPQLQPLQPFSEQYFRRDSGFATYADDWARVRAQPGKVPNASAAGSGSVAPVALTVDALRQFLRQPVDVFFKARLRVRLESVDATEQEDEPFELDKLEQFQAGQELLGATDEVAVLEKLKLSGTLPMAAFGLRMAQELDEKVALVRARRQVWMDKYPHALPAQSVALALEADDGGALTVSGTLAGLWCDDAAAGAWLQLAARPGAVLQGKEGEQVARAHVVAALWVNHLALCAGGAILSTVLVGVDGEVVFQPVPGAAATAMLQALLEGYSAAWARPLPVACKTAWAFLQAQVKIANAAPEKPSSIDPIDEARKVFEDGHRFPGEWTESPYLSRAFEEFADIEQELPHWAEILYGDMLRHASTAEKE